MGALLLSVLATAAPALAVRVEVQALGRGETGTVVGVAVQVAPEDRARAGERLTVEISFLQKGTVFDQHRAVVALAGDGSALLYREWPTGTGEVRVRLSSLDGSVQGAWSGEVVIPVESQPFAPPADAPADARALVLAPAVEGAVRFFPPPRSGGIGALQLELEAPPETASVQFYRDEELLFERRRPPWTVSINLGSVAVRTVVRAVARDGAGRFLGEDSLVLNAPSGSIPVQILLAPEGEGGGLRTVTVAVGRSGALEVELRGDDRLLSRWTRCPCVVRLPAAELATLRVLSATARAGDGERGEAVAVLAQGGFFEEVRVEQVELAVVVLDAKGVAVGGLTASDFTVFEDGQQVEVLGFSRTEDMPLSLGLMVDTSGSMLESFPAVRTAVAGFAAELLRPGDAVFLSTFDFDTKVRVPWTREAGAVDDALRLLTPAGGTSLYDALVLSLEEFRSRRGRTALVLLSDGEDTTSRTAWEAALRFARTMRVPIFPIGFNISRLDVGVRNRLLTLARETGGQAFFASKTGELVGAWAAVAAMLRSQYLLSYRSPSGKGEGEFRTVRVEVRGEGLTARTISGYYPGR